ncbi:RimK/LysX family protein [Oscillatoria sp. FACHB-1406]|uniref:putative ATP-dependent zinc protease n=1 Tax=Oscillatoria sp. FACHB-1406 TaxID=2692846 RepID=UPI0016868D6F|nr:ATP-dependent zinc protease [Oscillatoria sp. FACHB-1406]
MESQTEKTILPVIGWREFLSLPELGIDKIKAKIDTGARSSALHAFDIEHFERDGVPSVRFKVHPEQRNGNVTAIAEAPLLDERHVRNSGGQTQMRPVIQTTIGLGERRWAIELTLTNRDAMGFRMLLGRQGIRRQFWVDAGRSFLWSSGKEV